MSDRRAACELDDESAHVLVVDDDRRIRKLLQTYLSENGFRVTTAGSAAEGRSTTATFTFEAEQTVNNP